MLIESCFKFFFLLSNMSKRKLSQAVTSSAIDDDLTQLRDSAYQETDEYSSQAIKKLQKKTANEKRVPVVPPYSQWPEGARIAHETFIGQAMHDIELHKIVRPADPELHEKFRRLEAAQASEQGVASLSIYDARRPDPTYARNVLGTADAPTRTVTGPLEHRHDLQLTRVAEMRVTNGLDKKRRISNDVICSENFTDACIPQDCEKALHNFGTYQQVLSFGSKMRKTKSRRVNTLNSFIATIRLECATPIFCVRFLHDATIEICAHMETNTTYFAIFALSLDTYVASEARKKNCSFEEELAYLKRLVCDEITAERKKSEKRLDDTAKLLKAPIDTLSTEQLRQRAQIQKDDKEFRSLVDKFHIRFDEAKPENKVEQEIAQHCTIGVFAYEKSPSLLSFQCQFLYVYFATCQCLMDLPDPAAAAASSSSATNKAIEQQTMVGGLAVTSSLRFDFSKIYSYK